MVSPEQCETTPRGMKMVLQPRQPPPPPASTTRRVLLSLLALATATGAIFGVVVFGNEYTKDLHPDGSSHLNSVTLVDNKDRAIATADVESFVSLLDLPLLGTAELNKIDGLTFATSSGIQHRKVTGYSIAMKTVRVDGVTQQAPHLSLKTTSDEISIEISAAESRAWVQERVHQLEVETPIDTSSVRRLSGGGSCLENGACLYSRDELLTLDSKARRLSEGSFFARADLATYQADLGGGDLSEVLSNSPGMAARLEGTYTEDGHVMVLRISQLEERTDFYFFNASGGSKLITRNGSFTFDLDRKMTGCTTPSRETRDFLNSLDVTDVATNGEIDFEHVSLVHVERAADDFIRNADLSTDDCIKFLTNYGNMSSPSFMNGINSGNLQRRLAQALHAGSDHAYARELRGLMLASNDRNERLQQIFSNEADAQKYLDQMRTRRRFRELRKNKETRNDRSLAPSDFTYWVDVCSSCSMTTTTLGYDTYLTHFDLWIATRNADPTFVYDYTHVNDMDGIVAEISGSSPIPSSFVLELSGSSGVGLEFQEWSNFQGFPFSYFPSDLYYCSGWSCGTDAQGNKLDSEMLMSKAFWHILFPGSCNGGYGFGSHNRVQAMVGRYACYNMWESENFDLDLGCAAMRRLDESKPLPGGEFTQKLVQEARRNHGPQAHHLKDDSENASGDDSTRRRLQMSKSFCQQLDTMVTTACDYFMTEVQDLDGWYKCQAAQAHPKGSDEYNREWGKCLDHYVGTVTDKFEIGNAWASYLMRTTDGADGYKTEYVVSFQGTKATDLTMIQYNNDQVPVMVVLGVTPFIIPRGYYRYMNENEDCLMQMIAMGFDDYMGTGGYGVEPSFITGHSLGGAAATLFSKKIPHWYDISLRSGEGFPTFSYPRLVTFGAAPVSYQGTAPYSDAFRTDNHNIECYDTGFEFGDTALCTWGRVYDDHISSWKQADVITQEGWIEYEKISATPCKYTNPNSVAFRHKFDPIPSIGMWGGHYVHQIAHGVILSEWKEPGQCSLGQSGCGANTVIADTSNYLYYDDGSFVDVKGIREFLCHAHSMKPMAVGYECVDKITSYMTMMNPFPCGQILIDGANDLQGTLESQMDSMANYALGLAGVRDVNTNDVGGTIETIAAGSANWLEEASTLFYQFEHFENCQADWVNVMDAYYISAVVDMPTTAGVAFAFTYVHSTYGNYPLCVGRDNQGKFAAINTATEAGMFPLMSDAVSMNDILSCENAATFEAYNACLCAVSPATCQVPPKPAN
ncbi:hypothetical protein AURANDRAFT_67476 [Aureococcus anophagefferens]|uniref:Uncharacterized protein n=1 Tax=Aureococcus anophagefferens TaxID=44056 RepID=F0YLA3_AURAN|nr:hypothetical protein AURANDRAFT_67476 [Aureococcus anophagefferens]EGB04061.1 hypothetical protein AURANDRAFT_67476 [Aureococcus anophagefferens]|eukprot:XP_009041186.1 hypothetical protein AURANDRAFT_67476 [Aureococcus anophagefferens]